MLKEIERAATFKLAHGLLKKKPKPNVVVDVDTETKDKVNGNGDGNDKDKDNNGEDSDEEEDGEEYDVDEDELNEEDEDEDEEEDVEFVFDELEGMKREKINDLDKDDIKVDDDYQEVDEDEEEAEDEVAAEDQVGEDGQDDDVDSDTVVLKKVEKQTLYTRYPLSQVNYNTRPFSRPGRCGPEILLAIGVLMQQHLINIVKDVGNGNMPGKKGKGKRSKSS
ncbi:hypothetical protein SAMD00019534_017950 [Acytostelium subglobosum LB1]|uniref:hypothetical protein n=1 Tax=Acytostelium subglobosum LB1 TaxID=1410327 RepID=UPI000644F17A|nr:hypothetical protein SAMD00019534_017950 [Acytostelium subglobosum LB1]GAM18620.1 hypothetical protein SAMD00019534_017950 [Acytostelium subglobosum LB1]|eukprot:XP_012757840.1 hypothetical protein SAMD00019534_017950 [Acytostelium subglobosum LB1]